MHLGDFLAGETVEFKWNTISNANGSASRVASPPNGTISIYKNGSATQRASSSGITDTPDFDGLTGVHHLSIDLSDNADAGFYAAGNDYQVVVAGLTIDALTINAVIAEFSIENRSSLRANDVVAELATVVAAEPTVLEALAWLVMMTRNKRTTTASVDTVHNDAGAAVAEASVSDNGTTFTKEEYAAP